MHIYILHSYIYIYYIYIYMYKYTHTHTYYTTHTHTHTHTQGGELASKILSNPEFVDEVKGCKTREDCMLVVWKC